MMVGLKSHHMQSNPFDVFTEEASEPPKDSAAFHCSPSASWENYTIHYTKDLHKDAATKIKYCSKCPIG